MRNLHGCILLALALTGCTTTYTTRVDNRGGQPTKYEDVTSPGAVSGTGIEAQDIVSATDQMMRDMLANQAIASRSSIPRVVIDAQYFHNESSQIINKNLLTDRLRTELVRAANGRIVFLAREAAGMTEEERALEQQGVVTGGTQGQTQPALGYDYRLDGRIASLDAMDPHTGRKSRYFQITFELIERGTGAIIWSGAYEFRKTAQDDILYR
ncbi:MAG: penicillin-binding protein activator LpoB [Verrucomicrobiia bacterium]|jgi:PBP1b-binding outer membrane lipoprotein LpoB